MSLWITKELRRWGTLAVAIVCVAVGIRALEHWMGVGFGVLPLLRATQAATPPVVPTSEPSPFDVLLDRLRSDEGQKLERFLRKVDRSAGELGLSNDQLDVLIEELRRIKRVDRYQEPRWGKTTGPRDPDKARWVFVNRQQAAVAIEALGCRKIANDLRERPFEDRVTKILQFVEGNVTDAGWHASTWFSGELWRIGSEAVPFILERMEQSPKHQLTYIRLLSQIGDPRGIAPMIRSLQRSAPEDALRRCEIISRLAAFGQYVSDEGKKPSAESLTSPHALDWRTPVISALIEAIQDSHYSMIDARMRQRPDPAHQRFPVRVYAVRECAARGLVSLTGNDWGMLFNEDPASWTAWSTAKERASFEPESLSRTDDDLALLIENFMFRFMHVHMRVAAWEDPAAGLDYAIRQDVKRFRELGPRAVDHLVRAYAFITTEFPIWKPDLRRWVQRWLHAIDTPESRAGLKALRD